MTIASDIQRIEDAKAAMKAKLIEKGVDVADTAKLEDYAALVDELPRFQNLWGSITYGVPSSFVITSWNYTAMMGNVWQMEVTDPATFKTFVENGLSNYGWSVTDLSGFDFSRWGWEPGWNIDAKKSDGSMASFQCSDDSLASMGITIGYDSGGECMIEVTMTSGYSQTKTANLSETIVSGLCFPNPTDSVTIGEDHVTPNLITDVDLGPNVTTVGNFFLKFCNKLTTLTGTENLTSVGNMFLYNCTSLTGDLDMSNVTTIGTDFMYRCSPTSLDLSSLTVIPNNFMVSYYSFDDPNVDLTLSPNVTSVGKKFLYGRNKFDCDLLDFSNATSINLEGFMEYCPRFDGTVIFGRNVTYTYPQYWYTGQTIFGYCHAVGESRTWGYPTIIVRSECTGANFSAQCFSGNSNDKYRPIFKGWARGTWINALPANSYREVVDGGDE